MVSPLIRKAMPHVARTLSAVVQVLKEAAAGDKSPVSYVGFDIPEPLRSAILLLSDAIDEDDLAEDGREDRPHVTLKFGLQTQDVDEVREALAGYPPIRITLGGVSLFRKLDADVVKIDVLGDDIHKMNAVVSQKLHHKDGYEIYKPHITLAYVKPGRGEKYVGESGLEGASILLSDLVFSDWRRNKAIVALGSDSPVYKSWGDYISKSAAAAEPPDVEDVASLLYGIYGDEVFDRVGEILSRRKPGTVEKAWDAAKHPRGKGGRFIKLGSGEARTEAIKAVTEAIHKPDSASADNLVNHLSVLTAVQIRQLAREHGKKIPSAIKRDLHAVVASLIGVDPKKAAPKPQEPAAKKPTATKKPAAKQKPATKPERKPTAAPAKKPVAAEEKKPAAKPTPAPAKPAAKPTATPPEKKPAAKKPAAVSKPLTVEQIGRDVKWAYDNAADTKLTVDAIRSMTAHLSGVKKPDLIKIADSMGLLGMHRYSASAIRGAIEHRILSRKGATQRAGIIDRADSFENTTAGTRFDVKSGPATEKVSGYFFANPEKEVSISDVAKKTGLDAGAVRDELAAMVSRGRLKPVNKVDPAKAKNKDSLIKVGEDYYTHVIDE